MRLRSSTAWLALAQPPPAPSSARIVLCSCRGDSVPEIGEQLGVSEAMVRRWLQRFKCAGIDGLVDQPRSSRPPTHTSSEVGDVVAVSRTKPDDLGLHFACWMLDRLAVYLNAERGIAIKRSWIGEILQTEGLRWRQERWFGEWPDPAFSEKMGPSSRSTWRRRWAA